MQKGMFYVIPNHLAEISDRLLVPSFMPKMSGKEISTLRSCCTPPSTDSSAEHEIFPVDVEATQV